MHIVSDYDYELPDEHADTIIAGIPDDIDRERIQEAIDETKEGDPVRLPLQLADVLLDTYSEWERAQDEGQTPIETMGRTVGEGRLSDA